ncbi:MAG: DUF5722 domain-containing protein [Planctomycetota bacterium]
MFAATRFLIAACALLSAAIGQDALRPRPVDSTPYPTAVGKKGLQVQMVDDAIALGVKHAAINIDICSLIARSPEEPHYLQRSGCDEIRFRKHVIDALDSQVRALTAAGVVVTAILLTTQTGEAAIDDEYTHPDAESPAPNRITAFSSRDESARIALGEPIIFLAERYSGDPAPHGRIWNWIVGNEVNAHWYWYNQGRASLGAVAEEYASTLHHIDSLVRSRIENARIFVSLDHHWTIAPLGADSDRAVPAREFLLALRQAAAKYERLRWHVAFHPYPENLFDPRFWRDTTAPDRDDAQRVTFRNLDVLLRFLAREDMLLDGEPRRVILSEQGFHCRDDQHGERDQAAAFALAWSLVTQREGIDAFILHRHVDHSMEGGLRLGLWSRKADSMCAPDRRRLIAEVFRDCDTKHWPACARFALPVLGVDQIADWKPQNSERAK